MESSTNNQLIVSNYPYFARFRTQHAEFRIPELESLAVLFNARDSLQYDDEQAKLVSSKDEKVTSPFLPFNIVSEEAVSSIVGRSVGILAMYELMSVGDTYDEMIENIKHFSKNRMDELIAGNATFRFHVDTYGRKFTYQEQVELMRKMGDYPLWGNATIDLKNPQEIYTLFFDFAGDTSIAKQQHQKVNIVTDSDGTSSPSSTTTTTTSTPQVNVTGTRKVYLGRRIRTGIVDVIEKFNVKKRVYIGTTSMDSELSILVANQALARSGTMVLDPFAGTGSLLLTCAHFGSYTMGGDIDIKMFKGWDSDRNIFSNFKQYEIRDKLIDIVVADNAHCMWRSVPIFHAIVADPPYGIRAGARKVGKKRKTIEKEKKNPHLKKEAITSPEALPHLTQCIAYSVDEVLHDLLKYAARMLVKGGRLVYWLPTTDQYKDSDLPLHPCLRIVANSEQPLTMRWRRRLITMEKVIDYDPSIHENLEPEAYGQLNLTDSSHKNLANYWLKRDEKQQQQQQPSPSEDSSKEEQS